MHDLHDLDVRLERLAAEATRDAVPPELEAVARRGRRRRRRRLAGSALLVAAVVAAGLVLPARLAVRPTDHPVASPATDVSGAGMLTGHWFGRADASVFLAQDVDPARRQAIRDRIQALDVVDAVFFESRQEAYDRVKVLYRNRPELLVDVGPEAMPESFRVRLDDPDDFKQLFLALCRPGENASGKQRCIRGVELVADIQAVLKPLLIGKAWLARSDLTVILPEGTTAAEREAVRARLEAIDGVRGVVYETPAQAFRRLPEKLRKPGTGGAPALGPEAMPGSFRVTLDDATRVGHLHRALCGSRKTGACPFGLVLLDNRPRWDQATGAGAVRVRP
jgi:cell division protein FtsX